MNAGGGENKRLRRRRDDFHIVSPSSTGPFPQQIRYLVGGLEQSDMVSMIDLFHLASPDFSPRPANSCNDVGDLSGRGDDPRRVVDRRSGAMWCRDEVHVKSHLIKKISLCPTQIRIIRTKQDHVGRITVVSPKM